MSEFPPFEYVRFFPDAAGEPHLERLKVDFEFEDHTLARLNRPLRNRAGKSCECGWSPS
jgi:hypothetical protein